MFFCDVCDEYRIDWALDIALFWTQVAIVALYQQLEQSQPGCGARCLGASCFMIPGSKDYMPPEPSDYFE